MELKKFLQLLLKNRYVLILVPIITVIITYFLTRKMPDMYTSQVQIATGIVDNTQSVPSILGADVLQENRINQEFSNLIEMMRLKKIIDLVSYRLMLNDMEGRKPFRSASNMVQGLSPEARRKAIAVFKEKYRTKQSLNLTNPEQKNLDDLLHSMQYHESDLRNKLSIFRLGSSDFIYIQYESENPQLSAYVINTLADEFLAYYSALLRENHNRSVAYLEDLLKQKFKTMNDKILGLQDYKIKNGVLNISEQSSSIYGQMMAFESKKKEAEKDVASLTGAIRNINNKFEPNAREYVESTLIRPNQQITETREKLRNLYDKYVENDFDEWYQPKIDSLQNVMSRQINAVNDNYVGNPLSTAQSLRQQKVTLEIQLDLARYSVQSLNKSIENLNKQFSALVPNEAVVQSYDRDIEVASKEYLEILNRYNQIKMESGFSGKLRIVQDAMPGTLVPSKKMLLVIISGVISLIFCLVVFFVIYYFDSSIRNAKDLANQTGLPVLSELNRIDAGSLQMKSLWESRSLPADLQRFKDQIRSVRLEVAREMQLLSPDSQVLMVNSIGDREGKSLMTLGLAYAFAVTNRKVLLIDGNFHNPGLTKIMSQPLMLEEYLMSGEMGQVSNERGSVFALGNQGGDKSLLELIDSKTVTQRLAVLKEHFDIILVETASLIHIDKSREWLDFADAVVSVFEADQSLTEEKKAHVAFLESLKPKFLGWVLNKVGTAAGRK
ncbi:lipopolysaccharide biosynthesis protein [Pedobacter yulinensis]|uniref:Lipopolysaccharide biosynthesis protein n=1 Tax=Pedobacter yulinensis TaxID=2126353 RepID=A0A2T3HLR2_9SPHI|nr:lipopolysaccharide biosynthesis protein [Pedobacter yulinensis]PST83382.1 lipopolysaccharide biosynthesis protein [Pedobacter yulinensis]